MHYTKTDIGQQAFKARSPQMSARQRPTFLLFDGKKSLEQVLYATAGLGVSQSDVDHMLALGFLAPAQPEAAMPTPVVVAVAAVAATPSQPVVATPTNAPAASSAAQAVGAGDSEQRYAEAWPIATHLVDELGMSGYLLSQAVESATDYAQLLALLPKIQSAAGPKACRELERILKA